MDKKFFIRICGAAGILAGILSAVTSFPTLFYGGMLPVLRRFGDILVVITLTGIFLYHRQKTGTYGLIAYLLAAGSEIAVFIFADHTEIVSFYAMGLLMVAVVSIYFKTFPTWIPMMWIVGIFLGMPGFIHPGIGAFLQKLAAITFGLGFMGSGYFMTGFYRLSHRLPRPPVTRHGHIDHSPLDPHRHAH